MTPDQEVLRGQLAADVLANPVYADAYAVIEQGLIAAWRDAKCVADREDCHRLIGLLAKTRAVMESVMRNGKMTESEILRKHRLRDRLPWAA